MAEHTVEETDSVPAFRSWPDPRGQSSSTSQGFASQAPPNPAPNFNDDYSRGVLELEQLLAGDASNAPATQVNTGI